VLSCADSLKVYQKPTLKLINTFTVHSGQKVISSGQFNDEFFSVFLNEEVLDWRVFDGQWWRATSFAFKPRIMPTTAYLGTGFGVYADSNQLVLFALVNGRLEEVAFTLSVGEIRVASGGVLVCIEGQWTLIAVDAEMIGLGGL
jgi:hypothetical protein